MSADPALTVSGLVAGYARDLPILHGIDMVLPAATMAVVIGPNGAGKSTLVKAIAGLVPVSAGTITCRGVSIAGIRPDQMGPLGIAYVPQNDNVFRTLSVQQNLALALRAQGGADAAARLDELFALFPPLAAKHRQRAGALSGGQRQMLAVAMAMARRPSVLMMDEPSAGLSPRAAQEVLELARGLTGQGVSVLLVEQNVNQALHMADHCYILAEGRNQLDDPADRLRDDPVVAEIYLGGRRMVAS